MASAQSSTAFDRIPLEIYEKIAQVLPANTLSNFALSSRKFYKIAIPNLYRTVHFLGITERNKELRRIDDRHEESCFGIHRAQSWLSHPDQSSSIIHLEAFLTTITTNPELRSYITGASFEWDDEANAQVILLAKRCLKLLKPSLNLLHLAIPNFDTTLATMNNVTFLEVDYPDQRLVDDYCNDSEYDVDIHEGLRDSVYSIFCIPTLRHLSLRSARTWRAFYPPLPTDDSRVGTSNIISLSLPYTVPLTTDLKEILTWPKALRYFYHENEQGERCKFQNYSTEQVTSAEIFIQGIYTQRHTIEELIYNNDYDCCGTDETTFGTTLREFVRLKRLAVSRDCLVRNDKGREPLLLHETLPPNLEEAWILIRKRDVYNDVGQLFLKHALRGVAMNKAEYCPSLKNLVLWKWDSQHDFFPEKHQAEAARILDALDLVSTFQEIGVQFNVTFSDPTNFRL